MLDLSVEFLAALQLVQQECVILAIHQAIFRRERGAVRRQLLQPAEMRRTPVRAFAEDEATRGQELQDVVPRPEDLAPNVSRQRTTSRTRSSAWLGMRTATNSPAR